MQNLGRDDSTFGTNVGQLDASLPDKLQRLVHVLCFLNAHSWILVISSERGVS